MKKLFILFCIMLMLSASVVFADAIGPEFPNSYHNSYIEVSPIVYIMTAIIVIVTSCIISVLINKKGNKLNITKDAVLASEEKRDN